MDKIYPSVNKDIIFRIAPENEVSIIDGTGCVRPMTSAAWQVLKLCNGGKNIVQITKHLSEDWEINMDEVLFFLEDASKRGYISFNNNKTKTKINIIGSEYIYFPSVFSLILTDKCNLNCNYCFGNYKSLNKNYIDFLRTGTLFNILRKNGATAIELTGGEPLLHPNFLEIFNLAVNIFPFVNILSNGVLFNDKIFSVIQANRKRIGIQISIDGVTEKTNSIVRGKKDTWIKTLNTIKKLIEIGVSLRITYTLTNQNIGELDECCELMRNIGVKNFGISIANTIGRGAKNSCKECKVPYKEGTFYKDAIKLLNDLYKKYDDIILSPERLKEKYLSNIDQSLENCGGGWKIAAINPMGDILACQLLGSISKIGNIFHDDINETFSLKKGKLNFFRNFKKDDNQEECVNCQYKDFCAKCFTRIYIANRELIKHNKSFCPIAVKTKMCSVLDFSCEFEYAY